MSYRKFALYSVILLLVIINNSIYAASPKKLLKEANSLMKSDQLTAAERTINEALTNPETNTLPQTWNIAGQIQKKILDTENQKAYLRKPYDTLLLYNSTLKMIEHFYKCDELAQIPDEKGRIKNKYRNSNATMIINERINLINGGIQYNNMSANNSEYCQKAFDFFATYVESASHPMLESWHLLENDTLIPQIAYYASVMALKLNDYEHVEEFSKYAEEDSNYAQIAAELFSTALLEQGDTIKWVESLQEGFMKYPKDKFFFANLVKYYLQSDKMEEAHDFVNKILAKEPNNSFTLYIKGFLYQNQQKYDEALESYIRAVELDSTNADAYSSMGFVYCLQAQNLSDNTDINDADFESNKQKVKELYEKAQSAYEKARELEPEKKDLWLNGLYRVYYNLNMGDHFNEIENMLQNE